MADQSIGMMEGAFFVPKADLLNWANGLLDLNLIKIEQLGTGAVYCQIFDTMFPGKIKINKVNWRARNEWEFIQNFKILQQAFEKCNIKKHIEIEKLSKSKYQDNLEFIQWFKRFFDLNGGSRQENYDPKSRRNQEVNFSFVEFRENPKKR